MPVQIEESATGDYVAVRHGVVAGQRIVANGARALAEKL